MKKKLLVILSVSTLSIAGIASIAYLSLNNSSFVKGDGLPNDYSLVLNGEKNVLDNTLSSGVFHLSDERNTVDVSYSGYTHSVDTAWGSLANDGYFGLDDSRVGGLSNLSYHVSGDLKIEFGYFEHAKPTYYSAELPAELNSFNFPEDKGYPDTFKISNLSGSDVVIEDMTFFYSCSQVDQHVHVNSSIVREIVDDAVKYYYVCDICGAKTEERDFSDYKVTIDGTVYTPYNYREYNTLGSLDFDYQNLKDASTKRFILTINGDHSSENLVIDANHTRASQIYVESTSGAKIHDMTFNGGNGVLIFTGEQLTFVNGNLTTEAKYTTVKGPLSFEDTRQTKDAITVSNGQLTFENDVYITGYNVGVRLSRDVTGTRDLHQNSGTFTVENTKRAMVAKTGYKENEYVGTFYLRSTSLFNNCDYAASFNINVEISGNATFRSCDRAVDGGTFLTTGTATFDNCKYGIMNTTANVFGSVNMTSCFHGIHYSNLVVGDDTHEGKLLVSVDSNDNSETEGEACGMYIPNSNTINFYKGKAAFYSNDKHNGTTAIKIVDGWRNGMLNVSSDFLYGFANITYGFNGNYQAVGDNDYSNTNADTFVYRNVGDLASYCVLKPQGSDAGSTDHFKELFGIE